MKVEAGSGAVTPATDAENVGSDLELFGAAYADDSWMASKVLSFVFFDVAVRAKQNEGLRVSFSFAEDGSLGNALRFSRGVQVMEMQGSEAALVSTALARATEKVDHSTFQQCSRHRRNINADPTIS